MEDEIQFFTIKVPKELVKTYLWISRLLPQITETVDKFA